jgi:2-polyprenyl-6-hydroxyphenyl methylase/3-demethylubiquinone-9 3-methyltransferase
MAWLFWKRIEAALPLLGDLKDRSVLDFGCGGGVTFRYLAEHGCQITGCDKGACEMVREVCRCMHIDAEIVSDLSAVQGRTFDAILALDVLEHVDDLEACIDAFLDVSHAETQIVVSGPTETLLYRLGRALAGFSGDYHVRNIYDIERVLRDKDLERTRLKRLYFPFTLFRITSWRLK